MAPISFRRGDSARLAAGTIAVAYGLGALAVARGPGEFTTYAGASKIAAVMALGAGLGLVAAGLVASLGGAARRIGDLALVASFLWFAPFWVGWADGPPLIRSLATFISAFTFPLLFHLILAYPTGRLRSNAGRAVVAAVYLEALLVGLGLALFRNPFLAVNCWANCTDNVFLVRSLPRVARGIEAADLWFAVVVAVALAAARLWRLAAASWPARRVLAPVVLPGIALALATAGRWIALDRIGRESATDQVFSSIFLVACGAIILIAAGLLWATLRTRDQRRSVARIVVSLGEAPPPGSLESALAWALGDPGLRIAYWLPASGHYVDAHGNQVAEPVAAPGRSVTALLRDGQQIAVVTHAAAVSELERELGAAVRLALENERLQAEVLARLADLRASRARIVETGDAERRRLERNLHDGAQQRLLALSYDLRLAYASAAVDGDAETISALEAATGEAQAALGELRELAHGIYPAILAEAGLGPALATLAEAAPVPVEIGAMDGPRYPAQVEATVYRVVAEAVDDAARRDASHVVVDSHRDNGQLVVEIEDDGSWRTTSMAHLADRVGAIGGSLAVGPAWLRAEIPCE